MNEVLGAKKEFLIHFNSLELGLIANALNEICNGVHIEEREFETRLGFTRELAQKQLENITQILKSNLDEMEAQSVWSDGSSIQMKCITVFGDPLDLSTEEARDFSAQLEAAIANAEG